MKTPFLLKLILFGFLVSSCSSNDDSPAPNPVDPDPTVTAITLSTAVTEVTLILKLYFRL